MNLLQSDVMNARRVLLPLGINFGDISCGWHGGEVSLRIECSRSLEAQIHAKLAELTAISLPIAIIDQEEEDFAFNFNK